jgi:2,5-diketo-D-gluconate reductase A
MNAVPSVKLNNGVEIPQLGFGVFQVAPAETMQAVKVALGAGYRHIDTAQMYRNEAQVGRAVAESGIDPAEVFITSKLSNARHGYDDALRGFDESLAALGSETIDLYLIHWPLPTVMDFVPTWRALERVYAEGRARAIGVSNFQPDHLRRLADETEVIPALNQVELHPYLTQPELRDVDAGLGIATEAWSPIAQGAVLADPTVTGIARAYGRTPAQIVLRWHVQLGNVVIPKSVTPTRVAENFDVFGFELSAEEMARISGLNRNHRTGPDPDVFDYVPR